LGGGGVTSWSSRRSNSLLPVTANIEKMLMCLKLLFVQQLLLKKKKKTQKPKNALPACVYVHRVHAGAFRGQKGASGSLELKLQMVVSFCVEMRLFFT
jgi:hypothetical protein